MDINSSSPVRFGSIARIGSGRTAKIFAQGILEDFRGKPLGHLVAADSNTNYTAVHSWSDFDRRTLEGAFGLRHVDAAWLTQPEFQGIQELARTAPYDDSVRTALWKLQQLLETKAAITRTQESMRSGARAANPDRWIQQDRDRVEQVWSEHDRHTVTLSNTHGSEGDALVKDLEQGGVVSPFEVVRSVPKGTPYTDAEEGRVVTGTHGDLAFLADLKGRDPAQIVRELDTRVRMRNGILA